MRGGYIHNQILLEPIRQRAMALGGRVDVEVPTRAGRDSGFADLVLDAGGNRVVIEAEMSNRRVKRDLEKSAALKAHELWIVVPNKPVAQAVRRRLRSMLLKPNQCGVFVLTQGQALQRLADCFSLISGANVPGKTNHDANRGTP